MAWTGAQEKQPATWHAGRAGHLPSTPRPCLSSCETVANSVAGRQTLAKQPASQPCSATLQHAAHLHSTQNCPPGSTNKTRAHRRRLQAHAASDEEVRTARRTHRRMTHPPSQVASSRSSSSRSNGGGFTCHATDIGAFLDEADASSARCPSDFPPL